MSAFDDRGLCARCGAPAFVRAYWGHLICQPCSDLATDYFDAHDSWPSLLDADQIELDALGEGSQATR